MHRTGHQLVLLMYACRKIHDTLKKKIHDTYDSSFDNYGN